MGKVQIIFDLASMAELNQKIDLLLE